MPLSDLLHLLTPLVTSCRGFHEAWDASPAPAPDDPLTGRWEGEWVSDANGFRGPLRAVMTRLDDRRWRASFHATFARVLKACYSTDLVIDPGPERSGAPGENYPAPKQSWTFTGVSDLGVFGGGVYEYAGEVSGDTFSSSFRARTDHGTFRMRRSR
ncbi:MAG: hypothetical protein ACRD09_08750 [Vicinamibacterales bacterium]